MTYIWAWSDDDGNYINEADSLQDILDEIIDYYYDGCSGYSIEMRDESFCLEIDFDDSFDEYNVDANPVDVCRFLNTLSEKVGRVDKFAIFPRITV